MTLETPARDYHHGPTPHRLTFEESYYFRPAAENFVALPVHVERDPENDRPPFVEKTPRGVRPMTARDRTWNWWGFPAPRHPAAIRAMKGVACGRKLHYGSALPAGYCLQRTELWAGRWGENRWASTSAGDLPPQAARILRFMLADERATGFRCVTYRTSFARFPGRGSSFRALRRRGLVRETCWQPGWTMTDAGRRRAMELAS